MQEVLNLIPSTMKGKGKEVKARGGRGGEGSRKAEMKRGDRFDRRQRAVSMCASLANHSPVLSSPAREKLP